MSTIEGKRAHCQSTFIMSSSSNNLGRRKQDDLDRSSCEISKKLLVIVSGQFHLSSIKKLTLSHLNILKIGSLDQCMNLEYLDLSDNLISVIENLNNLEKLRTLLLNNNDISQLSGLHDLTNLTKLDLSGNLVSSIDGISQISNLSKLIDLNLKGNPISDSNRFDTIVRSSFQNIKYINGEHVLLRLELVPYDIEQPYKLPKESSWTTSENGDSIWDVSVSTKTEAGEQSINQASQQFLDEVSNCMKVLAEANLLCNTMKELL